MLKKCMSILVVLSLCFSFAYADFSDVSSDSTYEKAVEELLALKVITGYSDDVFCPENNVTRAEAAVIIMRALGFEDARYMKSDITLYSDIPVSYWASGYIYKATEKSIIDGYPDNTFRPDAFVTYEEMAKMIVTLLGYSPDGDTYPENVLSVCENTLENLEGVSGKQGEALKRWQVAQFVYNSISLPLKENGELTEKTLKDDYIKPSFGVAKKTSVDYGKGYTGATSVSGGAGGGGGSGGSIAYEPTMGVSESAPLADSSDPMPAPGAPVPETSAPMTPMTPMAPMATMGPSEPVEDSFPMDMPLMSEEEMEYPAIVPEIPDGQFVPQAGLLTAGRWCDNDNWDFWMQKMANKEYHSMQSKWGISTDKYEVLVTENDLPVLGAKVELLNGLDEVIWAGMTDLKGKALIFADFDVQNQQENVFKLSVTSGDDNTIIDPVILTEEEPFEVSLSQSSVLDVLDLMFMIDTTGSMGDELQYIKEELKDVILKIDTDVRLSCNYYRDFGDEYVVKPFDFTTNIDKAIEQMSLQRASGGGDYPEAVDLALLNGINEHEWNDDSKAKLLFLVLDAPPHYTEAVLENLKTAVKAACEKGIKIIPVASSGVDKETEFLLRSIAIATNGTYIFLTDHSGIGNSHIEPTIGKYDVENLNDLILKTIKESIGQED